MHSNSLSLFWVFVYFFFLFNVYSCYYPTNPPGTLERHRCDEQRGLASETRMDAPHPQLAISLASINI